MNRRRILWVDYAKGIAILLVFLMHSAFPESVTAYISSFCMMLFFFLSGFVFSIRRYSSFWPFLWNKIRTLVIPGLVLSVVPFLIQVAFQRDVHSLGWYAKYFIGYCVNLRGKEGFGQIPWFLTCLFIIELGGYILVRCTQRVQNTIRAYAVVSIATLVVGYAYSTLVHATLPWSVDIAVIMAPYFILGLISRKNVAAFSHLLNKRYIALALLLLVIGTYLDGRIFGVRINPYMNQYGNILCFLAASIGGMWLVLSLCYMVESCTRPLGFLTYCGRNTLVFYCINQAIESYLPSMLHLVGLDTTSGNIWMQIACGLATVIINIVICSACASVINRFAPFLLGRSARAVAVSNE